MNFRRTYRHAGRAYAKLLPRTTLLVSLQLRDIVQMSSEEEQEVNSTSLPPFSLQPILNNVFQQKDLLDFGQGGAALDSTDMARHRFAYFGSQRSTAAAELIFTCIWYCSWNDSSGKQARTSDCKCKVG